MLQTRPGSHPPSPRTVSRGLVVLAWLLLCWPVAASAALSVNVGTVTIPPGAPSFVDIMITGGDLITDTVLYVQIGDGGPLFGGTAGPRIKSIDLSGSIWSSAAGGYTRQDTITYPTQLQEVFVSLNQSGQTVAGSGRLLRLEIDPAGFTTAFPLKVSGTVGGSTEFKRGATSVPATLTNGTLQFGTVVAPPVIPAVSITRLPSGFIQLGFATESSRSYQVQWNTTLAAGTWTPLSPALAGTGAPVQWTDDGSQTGSPPATATRRFYRLQILTP